MTKSDKPPFPPWFEWEFLQDGCDLENPKIDLPLPGDPHLLKIRRNDEYKIEAEICGQPKHYTIDASKNDDAGKVVRSSVINGTTHLGEKFEIIGYLSGDVEVQYKNIGGGLVQGSFTSSLSLHQIKKIQQQNVPVEWLTEWFINGIASGFVLFRPTSRRCNATYSRERDVLKNKTEQFDNDGGEYHSCDYAYIKCEDFSFIIHTIPREFGPEWSHNIGIEYRQEFGRIPSHEERIAISEIVSFIFGKHLLKVGFYNPHPLK